MIPDDAFKCTICRNIYLKTRLAAYGPEPICNRCLKPAATSHSEGATERRAAPPKRGAGDEAPTVRSAPVLVRMADVKPERVRWLWPGRIPLGKLTLWAGDPNLGKSLTTMDIAARLTRGAAWPDAPGLMQEPGGVIILSAEDDAADTIRPRLDAALADVSRVTSLSAIKCGEAERGFDMSADLGCLEVAIDAQPGTRLIIIDPVSAYMGTRLDSHRNTDVRAILAPLGALAAKHGVAVLAITHLSKGAGGKAIYRATGSLAFAAAARAAWLIAQDPNDADHRLLLPMKVNVGRAAPSWGYSIQQDAEGRPAVVWDASGNTMTANDVLAAELDRKDSELDKAVGFLREVFANGPVPKTEVDREAKQAGYSAATVRRAKGVLGIVTKKDGMDGGWTWGLPEGAQDPSIPVCAPSKVLKVSETCAPSAGAIKNGVLGPSKRAPAEGAQMDPLGMSTFGGQDAVEVVEI
ncbi:MAG: AAA family ATPase [Phycisphaerae bacterium]|nr:AAA family ATPase [Phycisphaerae bacterium]